MSSSTRALLILGGGVMQQPAITAAHGLGCVVHVADGDPACPGAARADVFHSVDLRDRAGLVRAGRTIRGLAGVFTAGTDFSSSVAYVAQELNLPGISCESSLDATDKGRMRAVLQRAGIPVPRFRTVKSADEGDHCCGDLPLPLVVKPVDNMGSRGVIRVSDRSRLGDAIDSALPLSRSGCVIVEEFVPGKEYSLDAIVTDGVVRVTGVADRHIFFPPHFVEMGHTIPASLSESDQSVLENTFRTAVEALGITSGAAKGDIFLDHHSDGTVRVVVGEVAARLSGGYMSGWTYPLATGVPLTEIGIRVALGEEIDPRLFDSTLQMVVAERALISCPGTVVLVDVPREARENVEELFLRCSPGDRVGPPSNNVEKVANAIARGRSAGEAEESALHALEQIAIHLLPGDPETEQFLFALDGAGQFARYRCRYEECRRALNLMPWVQGDAQGVRETFSRAGVVPVSLPPGQERADFLEGCYPAVDPNHLLVKMEERGEIRFCGAGENCDALGRSFWQPFLASGSQGVLYVRDLLKDGRVPREVGR